ncbi:sugar-binding domain-containing protein [Limibacter armeniacum]|uniref:glycoside hydrolase family 2 protein n=1 Tax=Limibacter armeniacum TaxID=466084 RepID=UPI002FE59DCB
MNDKVFKYCISLLVLTLSVSGAVAQKSKWKMQESSLMTPWAAQLDPENVLGEYPRPIMERADWQNLNGIWEFQEAQLTDGVPSGKKLKEEILVPFPWESALSGIRRQLDSRSAWYKRTFTVPAGWKGKDVLLHFGAVDYEALVYINGSCVGQHKGGYDPFSFNITPYLNAKGNQEIIVKVKDPGNEEGIAYGKQNNTRFADPQRFSYSPASGIWQTVWIEPVSTNHIADLKITTNIDRKTISVTALPESHTNQSKVELLVMDGEKIVATGTGELNKLIEVKIADPKLWSPDSPFLYDLEVKLKKGEEVIDQVKSYTGIRKIALGEGEKGLKTIELNNEFVFQMGPLDQGYWPDGIYTAPTDEALKWDIEKTKEFGFNMIRKHIKVEPQRWYYWCDKLGILVWQDMPSSNKQRTEAEKTQFETELQQMVKTHWNHPSIITWVVFNEHWGLYDPVRLTENVMAMDPTRLVTGNSGIDAGKPDIDYEVGHIKDNHSYRPPNCPFANQKRAVVCGEYGAIGYKLEGHVWDADGPWVHFNYKGMEAATAEYEKFIGQILDFKKEGLSAAVYTQWTDVENEMNGLWTYDRKEVKLDQKRVTEANKSTYEKKEGL